MSKSAPILVGDIAVHQVIEDDLPVFVAESMFPDATRDAVEDEIGWMAPRLFNTEKHLLETLSQSYVFRTPDNTVLVDTCVGNHRSGRGNPYWNDGEWPYLENLASAGFAPEEIDIVILTHLHVDHVGWNTNLVDGRWEPTFPNAKYVFTQADLDGIRDKVEKGAPPQYTDIHNDSIVPILDAGLAEPLGPLRSGRHEIDGVVALEPVPGHTAGQVAVRISSGGETGLITGDVLHHPIQGRHPEWSSMACEAPDVATETRRRVLGQVAAEDITLLPAHFDPCRVRAGDGTFGFEFLN